MGYTKLRGKRQANTQRITKRQWVNPSSSLARVFNLPSQPGQIHHPCIAHHEYRTPPQFSYSPVFQINHSCLTLTCNQICLVQSHQESGCEGYIYIYLRPGTSRHFPRNSRSRPSFTHSRYFFFFLGHHGASEADKLLSNHDILRLLLVYFCSRGVALNRD